MAMTLGGIITVAEQVVMAIHEGKEALPSSLPVCIPLLKKESLRSLAKFWVLFITNTKSYYSFFMLWFKLWLLLWILR